MQRLYMSAFVLVVAACNSPSDSDAGAQDAVVAGDGGPVCAADRDCEDGNFCTVDRCRPGTPGAAANGCVDLGPPCADGESCIEEDDRCGRPCNADEMDADGDGERSRDCGGMDCNDTDPFVYPNATETCDAIDNDCDPFTLASTDGDLDGDGYVSRSCCNGTVCGDDCDDARLETFPDAPEQCDELDNDCNEDVDEGLTLIACFPDDDGDGWGRMTDSVMACRCSAGTSANTGDCHDRNADVHPDADFHGEAFSMPPLFGASWDYDCDGVEELRWTDGSMLGCRGTAPDCSLDEGWASRPLREECGEPADVFECGPGCETLTVRTPQECR